MRLTQSLYFASELSLMCYVDDPLAALVGTTPVRRRNAALMVLVWEALGFKLAYAKGQLGNEVTWTGGTMRDVVPSSPSDLVMGSGGHWHSKILLTFLTTWIQL